MTNVFCLSPEEQACRTVAGSLGRGCACHVADSLQQAMRGKRRLAAEFVFAHIKFLLTLGTEDDTPGHILAELKKVFPSAHIVVMAPQQQHHEAVQFVRAGASGYLNLPLVGEAVQLVLLELNKKRALRSELDYLRSRVVAEPLPGIMQTNNADMHTFFDKLMTVAPTKSTVLLLGETGTGKNVMAALIHACSSRKQGPFVSVHCGAIPDTLLESEMFGHEKGAFTGAEKRKPGKFEIARKGTLFLDEVGTLPLAMQVKLLQVLQDGTFNRLGGETSVQADVRLIAATNEDLGALVQTGRFRKDLYYRLNVFPLLLPPLRERLEDIPLLMDKLVERLDRSYGRQKNIHATVYDALQAYHWPGNIRELENLVERAYILEQGPLLTLKHFPADIAGVAGQAQPVLNVTLAQARRQAVTLVEKRYLHQVLTRAGGRIKAAAAQAGITERQLHKLMSRYGLKKEQYKPGHKRAKQPAGGGDT